MSTAEKVYRRLLDALGPQGWWPSKSKHAAPDGWEIVTGAVLVQHTSWKNVERALDALLHADVMSPQAVDEIDAEDLATLVRSAGPPRVKAKRLKAVASFFVEHHGGSVERFLAGVDDPRVAKRRRAELLAVHGVGPETADVVLLYAGGAPVFVVDAYKRRVMRRHGWGDPDAPYDDVQRYWQRQLPRDAAVYNEAHALLVRVGVDYCRARAPRCAGCPLEAMLPASGPCGDA